MRITKQLNQGTKQLNQGTKQLNQVTKQLNEVTKMTRHTITGPAVIGTLSLMSVCILVLTLSNQGLKVALSQTNTDYQEELKRRDEVLDECHKKYKEEVENVIGDAVNKVKLQQELSGQRELTKGFKLTADELEEQKKILASVERKNKELHRYLDDASRTLIELRSTKSTLMHQLKLIQDKQYKSETTKDKVEYGAAEAKELANNAHREAAQAREHVAKLQINFINALNEASALRAEIARVAAAGKKA
ncbi:uncharacterized protein LOC121859466 isoform X4 [Homarus americanus]|uniref:uncharacterized protein LOC121859466 isoform X4 n=1 Tax=Homarus americanus TaxID=6706 RepID=UPI001C439557|nr:uncharacterized protein LOC121859466 isoform X4 [Homarus americanus]